MIHTITRDASRALLLLSALALCAPAHISCDSAPPPAPGDGGQGGRAGALAGAHAHVPSVDRDGDFDETDLSAALEVYRAASREAPLLSSARRDHSAYDLKGDGYARADAAR